jgi:hydroxypyruvate isomerase
MTMRGKNQSGRVALSNVRADSKPLRGRIRQSVCAWCFKEVSLDQLARRSRALGLAGIDLVEPAQWDTLKKHGLICTMTPSHPVEIGLNDSANHAHCLEKIRVAIELTADAGFPNVICFSGNRRPGISDQRGLRSCATALKKVLGLAEKRKVTLCMELLNSKINHPGYMCDHTEWGAELVRQVASERFKLLYDIYHMQVQEGDVISTIKKHAGAIGHYHTAGVPGRHEIDQSQELNYPAVLRAIRGSGFTGYVAHEFIPTRNPWAALREAISACDV